MLKVAYRPDWPGVKFKLIVVNIMYNRKYKHAIKDRSITITANTTIAVIYGTGNMFVWSYIKKTKVFNFFHLKDIKYFEFDDKKN